MVWIDYAILAIVGISALFGILRGFVREALALFAWVVSYLVATNYADDLTPFFTQYIKLPWLPFAAAMATLFFATMMLTGLVIYLIRKVIFDTGVSGGGTDRLVGLLFGLVRGVVIVGIIVMAMLVTPLPQTPLWQSSMLVGQVVPVAHALQNFLPDDVKQYFARPCCEPAAGGKTAPQMTVGGASVSLDQETLTAAQTLLKKVKVAPNSTTPKADKAK